MINTAMMKRVFRLPIARLAIALDRPIPADANHVHLADHLHLPHQPLVASEPITVKVR